MEMKAGTAKSWMEIAAPRSLGATRRVVRYSGRGVIGGMVRTRQSSRCEQARADFRREDDGFTSAAAAHRNMNLVAVDGHYPDRCVLLLVMTDVGSELGGTKSFRHLPLLPQARSRFLLEPYLWSHARSGAPFPATASAFRSKIERSWRWMSARARQSQTAFRQSHRDRF